MTWLASAAAYRPKNVRVPETMPGISPCSKSEVRPGTKSCGLEGAIRQLGRAPSPEGPLPEASAASGLCCQRPTPAGGISDFHFFTDPRDLHLPNGLLFLLQNTATETISPKKYSKISKIETGAPISILALPKVPGLGLGLGLPPRLRAPSQRRGPSGRPLLPEAYLTGTDFWFSLFH